MTTPTTALRWPAALVLAVLLIAAYLGMGQLSTPEPATAGAPAGEFSAARALEHLRQIARQPHPAGSAEHRRVGDYILSELEGLGVEAEVQETIVSREFLGLLRFARVRNILGRIPGRDGQRAVLVAAHYDSVSTGPGAGDNGSAVAAMLESIRVV